MKRHYIRQRAACVVWMVAMVAPASQLVAQDQLHWQPSIEAAQAAAAQSNRLVLVHFWSPTCKPCMQIDKEVFSQPTFGELVENAYVPVKINADASPAIAKYYGVKVIPTDVLLTPNGQVLATLQSPPDARNYLAQLDQVTEGYRQLLQTGYGQSPPQAQNAYATAQIGSPPLAAPIGAVQPPGSGVTPAAGYSQQPNTPTDYQSPPYQSPPYQSPPYQSPPYQSPPTGPYQGLAAPMNSAAGPVAGAPVAGAPVAATAPSSTNPQTGPPASRGFLNGNVQPAEGGLVAAIVDRRNAANQAEADAKARQLQAAQIQLPPGSPPLGLDGYCSVTLTERHQWRLGDNRWGAVHRGRTYLFQGPEEQKRFLANPDLYSPILSGDDPVLAHDQGQSVPGTRAHGAFVGNRVYLFASEETYKQFQKDIRRYSIPAMQASAAAPTTR